MYLLSAQEALLSITNAFEGRSFVNESTAATANATKYALDLFPNLGSAQADEVGILYAGLGTPLFQTNAVQGECGSRIALKDTTADIRKPYSSAPPISCSTPLPNVLSRFVHPPTSLSKRLNERCRVNLLFLRPSMHWT
jgi:hypothetical protein